MNVQNHILCPGPVSIYFLAKQKHTYLGWISCRFQEKGSFYLQIEVKRSSKLSIVVVIHFEQYLRNYNGIFVNVYMFWNQKKSVLQFCGSGSKMGDSGQSRLWLRLQTNILTPILMTPTPVAKWSNLTLWWANLPLFRTLIWPWPTWRLTMTHVTFDLEVNPNSSQVINFF